MDLAAATPLWFWNYNLPAAGGFTPGPGPVGQTDWLILGVDMYPNSQPNNGIVTAGIQLAGNTQTIFQVAQSTNFPGPWSWRGIIPFHGTGTTTALDNLFVEGTIDMTVNFWGLSIPAFNRG